MGAHDRLLPTLETATPLKSLCVRGQSEVSHRVLFRGWDFFFSTTTYAPTYVVVVLFVCVCVCVCVCPRNYLNNVTDII